jgi:Zn-dependent protease
MRINVVLALMVIGSFLVALPLHESGHALMASLLGDSTPREDGRQSLSVRSHIDPIGMLMCVLLAFQPGLGVGFGWGKPVKPDPWKMRVGANAGVLLVAWAGLLFSLFIGVLVAALVRFVPPQIYVESPVAVHVLQLLIVFSSVNICLAIFNLFPLYPLDGYQIVYTLLPGKQAVQFAKSAAYGPLIILGLFFLLPFLAQLASPGLSTFPLFQLPYYIWLGSVNIIALVMGQIPDFVGILYTLR